MKKSFLKNFRQNVDEFSENFRHSWSRYIINCLLTGLAGGVPGFTSLLSFHIALASLGCMKDLGFVNPGTSHDLLGF